MQEYKAVLFDLDGTLVQTLPEYRYTVVGNTLRELGVSSWTESGIDRFWFEADRDEIIRRSFYPDYIQFWKAYDRNEDIELRKELTRAYPDVDFIPELRRRGYKTGIVTGAPQNVVDLELSLVGADNFDVVVLASLRYGMDSKPHPQGILECLQYLSVDSVQGMYVGNAGEDVLAAKNAGVLDVLVLRGEYEFEGIDASVKIRELYGLKDILGF